MINSKIIELALFFSSYSFVVFKFFVNVIIRIIKHFYTPLYLFHILLIDKKHFPEFRNTFDNNKNKSF